MDLSKLNRMKGKNRRAKRVGRGVGSGKGSHTSGRGQKGQKSRGGYNLPFGFEGGQVPLYRKMPHIRGFVNPHRIKNYVINLSALESFKEGSKVTPDELINAKLVGKLSGRPIKILGVGEIKKKLSLSGFAYSKSAKEKIEKAGGTII